MVEAFVFPKLQTERLYLRELTLDDSAALFSLFSNPEITRYMDIDPLESESESVDIISFHLEDSGCRWGLFDQENGQLIGTAGYHRWRRGEINTAEIGYDLAPAYWGKGVMQEALAPILKFGFDQMGLVIIEAEVERENSRSIGLLRKIGFHLDLTRAEGQPLDWYLLFKQ